MTAPGEDPRATLPPPDDIRPVVAVPRSGLSSVAIGIIFAALAVALFLLLDARRRALTAPERTRPVTAAANAFAPAPPLAVPPPPPPPAPVVIERTVAAPAPPPPPQPIYRPPPQPYVPPAPPPQPPPRSPGGGSEPAMVVDLTPADPAAGAPGPNGGPGAGDDTAIRATIIRNRGSLVPQGTLIAAVLETPIDSSRPGLARAIVSKDARGFDGSRVLIPRGSRLIGEYRSDVQPGQRRVLVTWTRLIRPDGVAIRIGSPAADSLGGSGIAGRVNTHFFARFTNAVLQSALTVGVNLASQPRAGSNAVFIGVPGQVANVGQSLLPNVSPNPTIKVRQGAEIAIFVARDLDFGGAAPRQ